MSQATLHQEVGFPRNSLDIEVIEHDDTVILRCHGVVDNVTFKGLENEINKLKGRNISLLAIDYQDIDFMDSKGAYCTGLAHKLLGDIVRVIAQPESQPLRLMDIVDVRKYMPVYHTVGEAVNA